MPGAKDFAALPTSWALTIWDALPVFLTIEAALAVALLAILPARFVGTGWMFSSSLVAGGGAYLIAFSSDLIAPYMVIAVILILAFFWRRESGASPLPAPATIGAGLLTRAWDTIEAVALSCGLAASVKILLDPYLAAGNPAWFLVAAAVGLVPIGTFGTAAVPAVAVSLATDSSLAGAIVLVVAAARPFLLARRPRLQAESRAAD